MKNSIVVLTGAGISAESGMDTFLGSDGLWENHKVEDVATREGFCRNPEKVYHFYRQLLQKLARVQPNDAHLALAEFERQCHHDDFVLITQNIDDLHQRAGSKNIITMHGNLKTMLCLRCHNISTITDEGLSMATICPHCHVSQQMRPNIVWFGETPYDLDKIDDALNRCRLFVAIGTSGRVIPAANFVQRAKKVNAHCVEINLEVSVISQFFDKVINQRATIATPQFFQNLTPNKP